MRFNAIAGMALLVALALFGGRQVFAQEKPTTHVVLMESMTFSPKIVRVQLGDRIEFKNNDLVPHTATAKPAGEFDSGLVKPGEYWVFTTTKAGTFDYACTFHPTMEGKLTVVGK